MIKIILKKKDVLVWDRGKHRFHVQQLVMLGMHCGVNKSLCTLKILLLIMTKVRGVLIPASMTPGYLTKVHDVLTF